MIRHASIVVGLMLLAGCSAEQVPQQAEKARSFSPPLAVIERIEARLKREPCIGDLGHWERRYHYTAQQAGVDQTHIAIHYTEAGFDGAKAGRIIEPAVEGHALISFDDRAYKLGAGIFSVRQNRIEHWYCGENLATNTAPIALELERSNLSGS